MPLPKQTCSQVPCPKRACKYRSSSTSSRPVEVMSAWPPPEELVVVKRFPFSHLHPSSHIKRSAQRPPEITNPTQPHGHGAPANHRDWKRGTNGTDLALLGLF